MGLYKGNRLPALVAASLLSLRLFLTVHQFPGQLQTRRPTIQEQALADLQQVVECKWMLMTRTSAKRKHKENSKPQVHQEASSLVSVWGAHLKGQDLLLSRIGSTPVLDEGSVVHPEFNKEIGEANRGINEAKTEPIQFVIIILRRELASRETNQTQALWMGRRLYYLRCHHL
ncbi:hypothetical protein C8J56DRAFT_892030 [Mycena floridula]|nr:hypothetical protein C8J56DRAFT_892030 [Mycena floridula]